MRCLFSVVCALVVLSASAVRADILLYPLPGTNAAFALQGRVSVNPGGTLTFRHPRFGNLFFGLDKVSYYKAPSTREIAARRLAKAVHDQDADACIEAASWALRHGLLPKFFEAASAAWKLDGKHPTVRRLAALKRRMDAPLPPTGKQELQMREFVPGGERMEFARSKHFLLLHDTPATKGRRSKKTRAEERLELLETVYASLLLKFCLQGSEVEVPGEPLKVVLFAEKKNFLDFAKSLEASLSKAAGFFDREANISVFFDQGTNEVHQLLELLDFVVSDRVFTHAASDGAVAHAYGQAWALTHFLMDRHFNKLIQYYWLIGQNTSDERLSPEEYQEAFDQVFGDVKAGLERDWRSYMRSLKTDLELVLEEKY